MKREEEGLTFSVLTPLDASEIGKTSLNHVAPTHASGPADLVGFPSLLQRSARFVANSVLPKDACLLCLLLYPDLGFSNLITRYVDSRLSRSLYGF